ncbi:hypothetical protein ACROYT_G008877 [Oculina patagonica]
MAAAAAASSACSSGSSVYDVSEEKTNGTRLAKLLIDGGTHVLRTFFHSIHPTTALQHVLNNNFGRLQSLKLRRVIFVDEWEKLFPSSGDPPDSKTFDITLLHLLLRELCHLTAPPTGWHKMPVDSDASPEANIIRITCFRNELCQNVSTGIPKSEFEDKWNKISHSLVALGLDQPEIDHLKTETIDHDTERRVDEEVQKWKLDFEPGVATLEEEVQHLKVHIQRPVSEQPAPHELSNCLPDEVPDVFGRSKEIQQVIEAVQSGTDSVTVITGGPGFGKTTVANKVAHELAKLEYCRRVLCCSLASKATLKDIATTMILTCSKSHSQPPENPQHWLLNWSKQQSEKVTFVLDNADDVLESSSQDQFVKMLLDMRALSKESLTFVITSRKAVNAPSCDFRIIRLSCLSSDEASNLLLWKVNSVETRQKLTQTTRIVELCGCVPLALCIVGSLLSVYKEDRLIQSLEKEPLDVLQADDISLEKAIETSFALLTPIEQEALAILSVFPGSFDSDAAETVITEGIDIGAQPVVPILRSLKNRSLLEQPSSCRYEVHQLIQAFVKKVSQGKYSQALVQGKKIACAYFVSRLADNANMYWSKDKCKESVEAFNEDRHNFEHFLHFYIHTMEKRDEARLQSSTSKFLDNFPQQCMYLEMCLLPSFYIMILEKLLNHFETKIQPVHTVEILCLLGHEKRKVGNQAQYKDLMKRAKQVYARNYTEFRTNGLSQVLFFNSYARFLAAGFLPRRSELIRKAYGIALILSRKKLNEHPETAATLLFIGRHKKSILYLEEAMGLFKRCLGEHFMTAQCHKALADVHFFHENINDEDKSFQHYEQALTIMGKLGVGGHKESILTLKNYALCYKSKGNYQEAINLLTKAKQVAEIELDDDHKWKAMIETHLALLYLNVGRVEEAKLSMKKGLKMYNRLEQPMGKLANRFEIKLFLECYPDTLL